MDEKQLLAKDIEARSDALDIARSFIVQAPAGSGKTELLIQRYLKLLSSVDHPEEVLAITFTRKAAAEMQYRVLDAMRTAHRGDQPVEEHRQLTAGLAAAALQRDQERGWQLLQNPRRLRIQTLDSLNALIARWAPISSPESAGGLRIVVDAEQKALLQAASLATLDWLAGNGPETAAIREVLAHIDNNTGAYAAYLEQMLATRDQWLPFVGSGLLSADEANSLRRRLENNLKVTVAQHLQRTRKVMPENLLESLTQLQNYAAARLIESGQESVPVCALQDSVGLPDADAGAIGQWLGVAELLLTKAGQFRRQVDKRVGFPPGDDGQKAAMQALLADAAEVPSLADFLHGVRTLPPVSFTDEQWRVLLALFRLLPVAVAELRRLFMAQGVSDHIEVALSATAALGTADNPGDVALLLDYQVRHLLVDEMQDTSSAQYRMLEALTGGWQPGDGRSLYCVGDPMQSIYRFRNAEVGQFLIAKEQGIGSVGLTPLQLRRNFRSGAFLVDWFNTVFPGILSDRDDPADGAVSYCDAVSVPELKGHGHCFVHPVFGADPKAEGITGRRVIADILAQHPNEEIALLVRGRTQLPGLLAELRSAGIPYRAVEIDRLTDLPEVIEVLALTRAAVHAADRLAWLALLRAPWVGLTWTDLQALVVNDTASTVWDLLQDEQRVARLSAPGRAAVEAALGALRALVAPRTSQSLRDLVETTWIRLGGPGILEDDYAVDNVYRYFDVLEKHERCGSLNDVATLEATLDLERVSSSSNARLQVMTMHRAKGLEFKHVVLFGLGRLPGRSSRKVLSWFDTPGPRGETLKIISPVGPRAEVDADPIHRFIELRDVAKDRHEQARLLYVACTRARSTLHLIGHCGVSPDGETFKPPVKGSLLQLLWPAVEPQYAAAFETAVPTPASEPGSDWLQPVLRRLQTAWTLPASVPPPGPARAPESDAVEQAVEFYWVGTEARIAGTIVHRWLHAFAENRAAADTESLPRHRQVTQRWLREMGIGETMSVAISERVEGTLRAVLADERGRWIVHGEGLAELALSGLYEGKIVAAIIDRVRIEDNGQHWIIDYKTGTHEGGNLAGFLAAEKQRYQPQLNKYAVLYSKYAGVDAKCALYFPLLRSFLEVELDPAS